MKQNKTKQNLQEGLNFRRWTDKYSESSTELAAHTQILKQTNKNNLMAEIITNLSVLTLNINERNSPSKGTKWQTSFKRKIWQSVVTWTQLINRNKHWLRVKRWKTIYHVNGPQKQAEESIHISDKVSLKVTLTKRDTEVHFTQIKGAIYQAEITIINLHVPNVKAPNFIKHTLKD
jgi:hypothetical protein